MTKQNHQHHGCRTSCNGLHADVTHTDHSLTKFIIDQIEKQQNNLARGIWYIDSLHFNYDKFYSVSRSVQLNLYAQLSLSDVLYPDEITSNNVEYEKLKKRIKYVIEIYNAYKENYSGNIDFDADAGSKDFIFKQEPKF